MKRSDVLLITLNALLMMWLFVGFASTDEETLIVGALFGMIVAAVNAVALFRRRDREPKPVRRADRSPQPVDEMDARTVLDLDARLEALEQAHADTARWRAMADSGQATGPAALADANGSVELERTRSQA